MNLSGQAISILGSIITGDADISPYRTGQQLVEFFNQFGLEEAYGSNFPSRRHYVEEKLHEFNDTSKIREILVAAVDPRHFLMGEFDVNNAVECLNQILEFDDYELRLAGKKWDIYNSSGPPFELPNPGESLNSLNTEHLQTYIARINSSIENDPSLAIGSTKELIEATLKTILNGCSCEYDQKKEDIPKLLKKVQKVLDLVPSSVDTSKKGSDTIQRVLNNIGSIAVGVSELRNLYGSGHGKGQKLQGITARHAKLVVGAGTSLCVFLLETYEHRDSIKILHLKNQVWGNIHTLELDPPGRVRCIAFHPQRNVVASGDYDHRITIWDLDTGKILHQYKRFYYEQSSGDVNALTFNHDGNLIISSGFTSASKKFNATEQSKIQSLDWRTGEVVASLPSDYSWSKSSNLVELCPGKDVIAFDRETNVELYGCDLKQHLKTLEGHKQKINTITFSPNGTMLASGGEDGQVRVCDWASSNCLALLVQIDATINALAIDHNVQFLAIGSSRNKILVFDLKNNQKYVDLEGHSGAIRSLEFHPDGQLLASSSEDDTIKIWHLKTGKLLHSFEGNSGRKGAFSVAFSKDGQMLAAGLEGGVIKVWQKADSLNV